MPLRADAVHKVSNSKTRYSNAISRFWNIDIGAEVLFSRTVILMLVSGQYVTSIYKLLPFYL